jgi:hypothetical protein
MLVSNTGEEEVHFIDGSGGSKQRLMYRGYHVESQSRLLICEEVGFSTGKTL